METQDILLIHKEKLRSLVEVMTSLKIQIFQLESIIKEMRMELIKHE